MKIKINIKNEVIEMLNARGSSYKVVEPSSPKWPEFAEHLRAEHPDLWERVLEGLESGYTNPHEAQRRQGERRFSRELRRARLFMDVDPQTGRVVVSRPKVIGLTLFVTTAVMGVLFVRLMNVDASPTPSAEAKVAEVIPAQTQPKTSVGPQSPTKPPANPVKPVSPAPQPTPQPEPQVSKSPAAPVTVSRPAPIPNSDYTVQVRASPQQLPSTPSSSLPPPPEPALTLPTSPSHPVPTSRVLSSAQDNDPFMLVSLEPTTPEASAPDSNPPSGPPADPQAFGGAGDNSLTLVGEGQSAQTGASLDAGSPGIQAGAFYQGTLLGDLVLTEGGRMLAVVASGNTVWQGEASLGPSKRAEINLTSVTVRGQTLPVRATVFGVQSGRRSSGLVADFKDEAPALVADTLRAALGGVSKWVNLKNDAGTVAISNGTIVAGKAEPDLLANVGGSLAQVLSVPESATALVRVATVAQGTPLHIFVQSLGGAH